MLLFFIDTATTEIYTLSLHVALPICWRSGPATRASSTRRTPPRWSASARARRGCATSSASSSASRWATPARPARSEEHTSELQSRQYLVCRLLLEKKNKNDNNYIYEE